jgi:molecular chaperone GrpE (heat shock protein)
MHSELQKYKEDLYSQLVRPILLDIIEIRDSIRRMVEVRKNKPEDEQYIPLKDFLLYVDEIDIILDKNNIEIFGSTEGSEFIPVRQRIIQKVITHDQALHGKVAASLSDGYNYTGKTISSEKVAVYLYKAPAAEPAENKEEINNG